MWAIFSGSLEFFSKLLEVLRETFAFSNVLITLHFLKFEFSKSITLKDYLIVSIKRENMALVKRVEHGAC